VATAFCHLLPRAYFLIFARWTRRTPRWLLLRRRRGETEKREMRSYKELRDLKLTRWIRRRLASSRLHRLFGNLDFNWPLVSSSEQLVAALLSSRSISRDVSRRSFIALPLTDVENGNRMKAANARFLAWLSWNVRGNSHEGIRDTMRGTAPYEEWQKSAAQVELLK